MDLLFGGIPNMAQVSHPELTTVAPAHFIPRAVDILSGSWPHFLLIPISGPLQLPLPRLSA